MSLGGTFQEGRVPGIKHLQVSARAIEMILFLSREITKFKQTNSLLSQVGFVLILLMLYLTTCFIETWVKQIFGAVRDYRNAWSKNFG